MQEQRELKISQFERFNNPQRYVYTEHGSKNRTEDNYQYLLDDLDLDELFTMTYSV